MNQKSEHSYNISNVFLKINQLLWRNSFMQRIRGIFYYIDAVLLLFCKKAKYQPTGKKKVLVVYNLALGDGIMFYEVSKSIRKIWPSDQYEITIVCQKAFKQLYEANGSYDKVIPLDFSGSVLNPRKRLQLFKKLRDVYYDIVLDPIGTEDCTTNVYVTRAVLGKKKIGVLDVAMNVHQMSKGRRNKIYDQIIPVKEEGIHLINYYAHIFQGLGDKECVARPANLPHVELQVTLPEKFFIVFPVASMDVKKWDVERYTYIAMKIQEKTGLPMVLCGTNHDRPSIEEMMKYTHGMNVVDAIGKTDIIQFTELIGRASLVVSNDTSAYHIAVARQVPTLMICGGYTYDRYAHYQYEKQGYKDPILVTHRMECYNCNNHCKYSGFKVFPCIDKVTKEDTWNAVEQVIDREGITNV